MDVTSASPKPPRYVWMILLALVALCYAPSFRAQFVYDDFWYIVRNPSIRHFQVASYFTQPGTVAAPESGLAQDVYRPWSTLSFAGDFQWMGLHPAPYHLENILLFVIDGFLIACLAWKLFRSANAALVSAAVFWFHPAQVQTAAWVSQRSNLWSLLGLLGILILWFPGERRSPLRWLGGLACYVLALLSKETAVVFPLLYGLVDHFIHPPVSTRTRGITYTALMAGAVGFLGIRYALVGHFSQLPDASARWGETGLGLLAFPQYIAKAFVPMGLRPSYGYPDFQAWTLVASAMAVVASAALIRWAWGRDRLVTLSVGWFLIALLPVLHIIPIRAFFADRFLFLPIVGLAWGVAGWYDRAPRWRWAIALWIACLAVQTTLVVPSWTTEERLWSYGVRQEPTNAFARLCYASVAPTLEQRLDHLRRALVLGPTPDIQYPAMTNLASAYVQAQDYARAAYWANLALAHQSKSLPALYNLARAYIGLHEFGKAHQVILRLADLRPVSDGALRSLDAVLQEQQRRLAQSAPRR